jgi:hypothetical protein
VIVVVVVKVAEVVNMVRQEVSFCDFKAKEARKRENPNSLFNPYNFYNPYNFRNELNIGFTTLILRFE